MLIISSSESRSSSSEISMLPSSLGYYSSLFSSVFRSVSTSLLSESNLPPSSSFFHQYVRLGHDVHLGKFTLSGTIFSRFSKNTSSFLMILASTSIGTKSIPIGGGNAVSKDFDLLPRIRLILTTLSTSSSSFSSRSLRILILNY